MGSFQIGEMARNGLARPRNGGCGRFPNKPLWNPILRRVSVGFRLQSHDLHPRRHSEPLAGEPVAHNYGLL